MTEKRPMILLLAAAAFAEPHADAAATLGAGFVGFQPGVAARGSLTAAHWGWGHVDGLIANRPFDEGEGAAPYRMVGVEAGFTPPIRRGVAGVAVAVDRAWDEPGPSYYGVPYTGYAVGAAWALHADDHDFEAFVGGGVYTRFDLVSPSWRVRLAWTLQDHLRLGLVGNGRQSLLAEVGAAW